MLKKTITYTDYNGKERTEDFYFNLTRTEITELEVSEEGGLVEMINRITKEEDAKEIFRIFKMVILKAYGKKSDNGRRFIKSDELSNEFAQTEAFNVLIMSFFNSEGSGDVAAQFMNGIVPQTK